MAERIRRLQEVITSRQNNVVTIVSFGEQAGSNHDKSPLPQATTDTSLAKLVLLSTRRQNRSPRSPQPPDGSAA